LGFQSLGSGSCIPGKTNDTKTSIIIYTWFLFFCIRFPLLRLLWGARQAKALCLGAAASLLWPKKRCTSALNNNEQQQQMRQGLLGGEFNEEKVNPSGLWCGHQSHE